jgi:hypothetical protein
MAGDAAERLRVDKPDLIEIEVATFIGEVRKGRGRSVPELTRRLASLGPFRLGDDRLDLGFVHGFPLGERFR